MEKTEFLNKLEELQQQFDASIERKHNKDSFFHGVRKWSRHLTWRFYNVGTTGQHILVAHFVFDFCALFMVLGDFLIFALIFWLLGHILDNCDGDLARIRGEDDPKWGEVDVQLHLWMNMGFWLVLGLKTALWPILGVILASRVILEAHRGKMSYGERYGERSKLWKWIVMPTNVNFMYVLYVGFALSGAVEYFIYLYAIYLTSGALFQTVRMLK